MGIKRGAAPVHAGIIFKEMIIDVLPNMSINYAAKALDVSRAHLTEVVNGRARITPMLALKISIATKTTTQLWLGMQNTFDLWEIENNKDKPIQVVEGSLTTSNFSLQLKTEVVASTLKELQEKSKDMVLSNPAVIGMKYLISSYTTKESGGFESKTLKDGIIKG